MTEQNLSQQYKLLKAEISADKLGERTIDVRSLIPELVFYENLEYPYITGKMILVDDNAVFDSLNFRGTEKITFEIGGVGNSLEPEIGGNDNKQKTFIMTKIERTVRTNDRTDVMLVSLVEEHFFLNRLIKVSKSFTANLETTITEIIVGYLKRNVDQSYLTKSAQGVRKINIPYMNPLEAVDWLRDRMTTEIGAPYFVHSSLYDNNIRISSLEGFLSQKAFNTKVPFIYSASLAGNAEALSEDQKSFLIENYKQESSEDSLMMVSKGALGSLYTNTDIGNGITTRNRFNIRDVLLDMRSKDLLPDTSTQTVFDETQSIGNKFIDEYDSRVYHQISSSGTYDTFLGYHDVVDSLDNTLKLKNSALRNSLYRNMVNIVVPGVAFMYSKASVGDIMKCVFNSSAADPNVKDAEELIDKQKSGNYLIYATRHMFRDSKHSVSINATKITKDFPVQARTGETDFA
jgi:hypothetical protein